MNDDILRDLERWEKGDLSGEETAERHPAVAPLLRVHRRVSELASAPVPPAEPAWQRVRLSLSDPTPRSIWRIAPAVALGSIALLASMGAIAAATAPVETAQAVDHVLHVVGHHHPAEHPPVEHPPEHTPTPPAHTPRTPTHTPTHAPSSPHAPSATPHR